MVKHNNVIPNQHFKKKWQFRVKTWFNQPARKQRRRNGVLSHHKHAHSALLKAPRPREAPQPPFAHACTTPHPHNTH